GWDVSRVLRRKKYWLTVHGKVLATGQSGRPRRTRHVGTLPASGRVFVFPDGQRSDSLSCAGRFGPFVFASELFDIDWVPAGGFGVTLDVAPAVRNDSDFVEILHLLSDMNWAGADGRWSIQQATVNWHGLGAACGARKPKFTLLTCAVVPPRYLWSSAGRRARLSLATDLQHGHPGCEVELHTLRSATDDGASPAEDIVTGFFGRLYVPGHEPAS